MKGEKVSTPLDKDGRGPSGLYNTHTVKALPPTSWHLTMFFHFFFISSVFFAGIPTKTKQAAAFILVGQFDFCLSSGRWCSRGPQQYHTPGTQPVPKIKLHLPYSSPNTILVSRAVLELILALQPPQPCQAAQN